MSKPAISTTSSAISVHLNKKGLDRYEKVSYPVRYGRYHEIQTRDHIFQFNLNNEITFARGKNGDWTSPQEWLKRSCGNDWTYYSTGGYTGVFEAIGEYYLPNLQYPTNSLIGGAPFSSRPVQRIVDNWHALVCQAVSQLEGGCHEVQTFCRSVEGITAAQLQRRAEQLFAITGGRVTVLPPDSRHVDYDIVPLTISTGCLYKCRFCKVKNRNPFQTRCQAEIDLQMARLHAHFGENLANYNSVFLGEHDALCCPTDLILGSVERSHAAFAFGQSHMRGANYFLFGSVDSFLGADQRLFDEMKKMDCNFYINLGFESADQNTLDMLGKPITEKKVRGAFFRMQEINDSCMNVEITANFVMDENLPDTHYPRFLELVHDSVTRRKPKGCIYLSPISFGAPSRHLLFEFSRLKLLSKLPTFLYIIQRL